MENVEFFFQDDVPENFSGEIILLSGEESKNLVAEEYLVISTDKEAKAVFKIRSEYIFNPFKQSKIYNNVLIVGCQDYFYLYDLHLKQNLLRQKMDGYFGSFEIFKSQIFVADMYGVFCNSPDGKIIWHCNTNAQDGVVFLDFTDETITCGCQVDPPDIWEDVVLDIKTGKQIQ